jgi:hypothetical protein
MADESVVVTAEVTEEHNEHLAHVPISENGKPYCMTVKDKNNPYSVVSRCSGKLKDAIESIPDELFLLDDQRLSVMCNADHRLKMLRVAFHREYERVILMFQRTGYLGTINASAVFGGICSFNAWTRILDYPEKMAYLTSPIVDYYDGLKSLQSTILERYQELLTAPVFDGKGKFLVGNARVVLAAVMAVEDRIFGKAVQRVSSESKSLNVTVPVASRSIPETADKMLRLEERIKELQAELYGVRKLGEPGQYGAHEAEHKLSPDAYVKSRESYVPGWSERLLAREGYQSDGEDEKSESDSSGSSDKATSDS